MTRLILTSASGLSLVKSGLADIVVPFSFRFVWGMLPSPDELAACLAARSAEHGPGSHWSDYVGRWSRAERARKDLRLLEFCRDCETIELWFDPCPNDQLQLVWLLDYFRFHPEIASRLRLRLVDFDLVVAQAEELGRWKVRDVEVTEAELETARAAWQAYGAPTPAACFSLLGRDLGALPLLRPALLDLLEELPSRRTGLGATEMRLLELIARGYSHPNELFYLWGLRQRRVFNDWEIGYLLDALAHGPTPAVAGLDDELRTIKRDNYRSRLEAYRRSRLSLTEFGEAVLAQNEDFSRRNPIHRWWGGSGRPGLPTLSSRSSTGLFRKGRCRTPNSPHSLGCARNDNVGPTGSTLCRLGVSKDMT